MTQVVVIGAGISGLATAYALQTLAQSEGKPLQLQVVEKNDRCGGKIWSRREEGYLCEWGPNGFLDNKPATLELCRALQMDDVLQRSNDNARKRYIFSGNRLHRLPENGPMFLRSQLLSWPGKIRLVGEALVPTRRDGEDETLAEFGRRRLGAEALDKLIAPMAGGIFAGDAETMSVKSCFPRIVELEQQYGGLLRAMVRLARQKRQQRKRGQTVASAAGPGGVLTSFDGGIQQLTDTLRQTVEARGAQFLTGVAACSVEGDPGQYRVMLADGRSLEAQIVISAAPAWAAAELLRDLVPDVAGLLKDIPYAPMNVICCGYDPQQIPCDLNGFGYLIPKQESCSILGTLWDSSIFRHRAPAGRVLLRSMMGGATRPQAADLSDEQVAILVQADLERIMGIRVAPEFLRIFRHQRAIPQYVRGHAQRLADLHRGLEGQSGLILTGNAYGGVGLNDCVANARKAAEQALWLMR
ncbi:MAG: protoporphyrinogen oxidase [Desulfuromonadaceae bacterium]|nr:protoporphyrinogen oxidase [Desulfuromonadaceae bacterium]